MASHAHFLENIDRSNRTFVLIALLFEIAIKFFQIFNTYSYTTQRLHIKSHRIRILSLQVNPIEIHFIQRQVTLTLASASSICQ